MNQTEQAIRNMISIVAGLPPDTPSERNLYQDLGVASAHGVQLLAVLEEHFGVSIPGDDFVDATTISKLVGLIDSLLEESRSNA